MNFRNQSIYFAISVKTMYSFKLQTFLSSLERETETTPRRYHLLIPVESGNKKTIPPPLSPLQGPVPVKSF